MYIVFLDAQWYDIDTSRKADKTSKIIVSVTQRIITLIKKEKKKTFKNYRQCYSTDNSLNKKGKEVNFKNYRQCYSTDNDLNKKGKEDNKSRSRGRKLNSYTVQQDQMII